MEATLNYIVKNHKDKEVFNGNYRQCRDWIRFHRAEFFCRVEPMPVAQQPTMVSCQQPGQSANVWMLRVV